MAVGAKRGHTELLEIAGVGHRLGIDQREINLRTDVGRDLAKLPLLFREHSRSPVKRVESTRFSLRIMRAIERLEGLLFTGPRAVGRHAIHLEHFVIPGFRSISDHVKFGLLLGEQNVVGALWKKIDRRCAEEFEVGSIDMAFEPSFWLLQRDDQIDLGAIASAQSRLQTAEFDELKPLRKSEVLPKQTIAFKTTWRRRQQSLVLAKADPAQRMGGERKTRLFVSVGIGLHDEPRRA